MEGITILRFKIQDIELTDLPEAVELHLAAFPDFFLSFLGPSFLILLYRFYITSDDCLALTCRTDNKLIGTLIGTTEPKGFYKRLARQHFLIFAWAAIKPLIRRPIIFKRLFRALRYRGDFPSRFSDGALLASICVDPKYRGKGIGKILVDEFEKKIWDKGNPFIYLITDQDNNDSVQEFYRKMGWEVESEFITPERRRMRRYWKKNPGWINS
jgi:colanic acid biosynthesis glycosyl transferase WcaI